jgi:hypothetical protein
MALEYLGQAMRSSYNRFRVCCRIVATSNSVKLPLASTHLVLLAVQTLMALSIGDSRISLPRENGFLSRYRKQVELNCHDVVIRSAYDTVQMNGNAVH